MLKRLYQVIFTLIRAYIVTENMPENEVHEFLENQVTDYKKLRGGIEFIEKIPKSPAGKILRRELRDAYNKK